MEKRTGYRLAGRRVNTPYFSVYHLDIQVTGLLMTEKGECFINLHSTFSHDSKASSPFLAARR